MTCPHCEPQTMDIAQHFPAVPGYRMLRLLGQGGMGAVFLAEDETLRRRVAIKVIARHFAEDAEIRARFLREARSMATVEHPNVVRIYAFGEAEDTAYIAMEYVEGESLADRIRRLGNLSFEEALLILRQAVEALQVASELQIVHRDIKPSNILIDKRNLIRVVDFGLAKLMQTGGEDALTQTGAMLGTPHYVAPEQARGESIDFRSDIYSLGIVLYEMLVGEKPFDGTTPFAIVDQHLHEDLPRLGNKRPEVSEGIENLIRWMTLKDPKDRPSSYHELLGAINSLLGDRSATPTVIPGHVTIPMSVRRLRPKLVVFIACILILLVAGVLLWNASSGKEPVNQERIAVAVADFTNETGEKGLDGLSGMLITSLEQSRRLSVLTRSRMLDILKKKGNADVERIDETMGREICTDAGVSVLITAAIRKFGRIYTLDLQALDPHKNEYLFTAKESGEGQESIPTMIDQLSENTRIALNEKSREIESSRQKIADVTTKNLEAYQFYFQGEQLLNKLRFEEAEEQFEKAIDLDPSFALAYYRMAYALNWLESERAREPMQKAMKLLEKAPEKERYLIKAFNAHVSGHNAEARKLYMEALKLYPEEKEALYNVGDLAFHDGDYNTALTYLDKVLDQDPFDERALAHVIWAHESLQQFDKMLEYAKQYVARIPSENAFLWLADAYNARADFQNALRTYDDALRLYPDSSKLIKGIGHSYIFMNDYAKAESEFKQLAEDPAPLADQREGYRGLAMVYAYLGQYEKTIEMSDKIIEMDLTLGDTQDLARAYAMKAFWLTVAGKPVEEIKEAIKKGSAFKKVADWLFFAPLFDSYLLMGDHEKASLVASEELSWGTPFLDVSVNAYKHCHEKNYEAAIKEFHTLIEKGRVNDKLLGWYNLAECYVEAGKPDQALSASQKIRTIFPNVDDHYLGRRAAFYPKSLFREARISEQMNNYEGARKSYSAFLELWKHADPDIPEIQHAKDALKRLNVVK